jgi:hypothetical protein
MSDPQVNLRYILASESTEFYLARVQRRAAFTEEQQVVHEVVEPPDTPPVQRPPLACDAQDWHGLPEAAPAPGEHAGLHGLRRRQERQHVLEDLIWQSVDPIASTCLRHRLPLARDGCLVLHYVEQLGCTGAENWMKKQKLTEIGPGTDVTS